MKNPALRDYPWRISYSSDTNNPVADFYIPALERATQYDRKSGFFNSTILAKVARGLGAMLHHEGRIRLIMGCQFTPEDLTAIQQGYELKAALAARLDIELKPPANFAELKQFEILSWLIQAGYLDIQIAIPLKHDDNFPLGDRVLDRDRIFHEKVGIFTDSQGDQLVFHGSNNESIGGWEANVESFHVFCSWDGDRDLERVQEEVSRFEQLWHNQLPNVRVFAVPEAVKQKLLQYAPITKPSWNRQFEFEPEPIPVKPEPPTHIEVLASSEDLEQERQTFNQLANLYQHPGCLDFCLKSIPISPWFHQIKILRRVAQSFPSSFLIADEVGLGKTIETGLILRYLLVSQKVKRVLILAPASVQPQWQEELREKFNLHFWSYSQGEFKDPFKQSANTTGNPWNSQNLILASSHLVRRQERMQELLQAEAWDLVILDEAHHARRKSPQARKDTPNRLLELMRQLKQKTQSLILLSATPMQIDPIEVFDLLHLLGLQGHWQYGDQFCDYFASLASPATSQALDFWQIMSVDYFKQGGKSCSKLQKHLEKCDRLLSYQMRDVWQQGKKLVNHRQIIENKPFIQASKQYLTVNTPLKDLMFRHTRDTLRQYHKLGLLKNDVPQRQVQDNAISLEPTREIPLYIAVSDYVRHFYRLAQKQNRKALGFLMTLYRKRLTSSFYAIRESLQRRLDALITHQGSSITSDDLADLEDADDAVIAGLESYLEPVDPQEIQYLEELLHQFENTGEDTKLSHFITTLRQELTNRESAIVFTQYTDTMDYLRSTLQQLYGKLVACYSGRGGELYLDGSWQIIAKEDIKRRFRDGEIKVLLCTESASEGLNLQTCGVLFNYDLPWNPMRVEQRIGRIDRIGQVYPTVTIHNFYYDGTVEAKVYRKLRDRISAFTSVVGNLQPILAQVPTFIEQAVMSADPEEEDVLLSQFESVLDTPPSDLAIEDMVAIDVEADLAEIRRPIPPTPFTSEQIEQLFTTSALLKSKGAIFEVSCDACGGMLCDHASQTRSDHRTWQLTFQGKKYAVTFLPEVFDVKPSVRFMNFGDPLFKQLIEIALTC